MTGLLGTDKSMGRYCHCLHWSLHSTTKGQSTDLMGAGRSKQQLYISIKFALMYSTQIVREISPRSANGSTALKDVRSSERVDDGYRGGVSEDRAVGK